MCLESQPLPPSDQTGRVIHYDDIIGLVFGSFALPRHPAAGVPWFKWHCGAGGLCWEPPVDGQTHQISDIGGCG
jgi:hypothetical protein